MKKIRIDDKIFIAGASGMAGKAICRSLIKSGYGNAQKGGEILTPSRNDLDLSDKIAVDKWLEINKPKVVIIASAKVGGILANTSQPTEFLLENLKKESLSWSSFLA